MTALTTDQPATRQLRRIPIPVAEPRPALRVVREPDSSVAPGQGSLPLHLPDGPPPTPTGATRGTRNTRDGAAAALVAVRAPSADALPDPRRWAAQFVQAAVEVAAGQRPASQLVRWTTDGVLARIVRRGRLAARVTGPGPSRAVVHSVRTCHPAPNVVEACAVVRHGCRVRAVALRLEGLDGRWRVTALEIG